MNTVIVNPPWIFNLPKVDRLSNLLGPLYLASFVRQQGHEVTVLDALREAPGQIEKVVYHGKTFYQAGLSYEEILARIPADTGCVAISAPFTNLLHTVSELSSVIKHERPEVMIVLGGGLPSAATHLCMGLRNVDVLVTGEGELAFAECLNNPPNVLRGTPPIVIRGTHVPDLNDLPLPDRSLVSACHYFTVGPRKRTSLPSASIITSRGCPYSCHFCSIQPTMGTEWRGRSSESVMKEIRSLVLKHGVQVIEFEDDNFLHDQERAIRILEDLKRFRHEYYKLLAFSLPNGVRVDKLNPEVLALMKDAGLHKIVLPIEHGDLRIRRKIGKPISDETILSTCHWASNLGIAVEVFVMVGYPDETREIFESGLKLLRELGRLPNIELNYLFPQPYPGTKLRKECLEKGYHIHVPDETLYCGIGPVITTPLFDLAELDRRRAELDCLIQRSRSQSSRTTAPSFSQAVRSLSCETKSLEDARLVAEAQVLQRISGTHNGSFFSRCAIPSDQLKGVTLIMSEFNGCDFSQSDLSDFVASWSIFQECAFGNAIFHDTNFSHCKIRNADLSNLYISRIDLTKATLARVSFCNTVLLDSIFDGSTFSEANGSFSNWQRCKASGAIISGVSLEGATFVFVTARDTLFQNVSFRALCGSKLSMQRSTFINCDFSQCRMTGDFRDAIFENCQFCDSLVVQEDECDMVYRAVWDGGGRHMIPE